MSSGVGVEFLGHQVEVHAGDEGVVRQVAASFREMPATGPPGSREVLEVSQGGDAYEVLRDGVSVLRTRERSEVQRALRHEIIQSFIRVHPHLLWLHAGAAVLHRRAVLFVGPYGRGKSTLVTELCRRGWQYASDDVVPVDLSSHRILPFPLTPLVRQDVGRQLPRERVTELRKVKVPLPASALCRDPAPIGGIVLPAYSSGVVARLEPYSPSAVALDIVREGINRGDHGQALVMLCARLVSEVPILPLTYSDAGAAADLVEAAAEEGARRIAGPGGGGTHPWGQTGAD